MLSSLCTRWFLEKTIAIIEVGHHIYTEHRLPHLFQNVINVLLKLRTLARSRRACNSDEKMLTYMTATLRYKSFSSSLTRPASSGERWSPNEGAGFPRIPPLEVEASPRSSELIVSVDSNACWTWPKCTLQIAVLRVMKRLVLSCLVVSCLALLCLVLSCFLLFCLVLSCLVLSCLVCGLVLSWSCLVDWERTFVVSYFLLSVLFGTSRPLQKEKPKFSTFRRFGVAPLVMQH